jgi:hypothetical protein
MLLRYSLPVFLIAGALALTGGVFVVVENKTGRPAEMVAPQADSDATTTSGYFDRARILLFLLRSRHWRKAAHQDTSQTEPEP